MFLIDNELKINLTGGKGNKLIYFKQNSDLLIPRFKCVSSSFFSEYEKDKGSLNILKQELKEFLKKGCRYAVRSSAVDEDSELNSFAGIHDSFLNVNPVDVIDRIFDVYKSAFSSRAIEYRKMHNISVDNIKIAVVVQEMVDADYAGVINTINPVTNNPDEVVISVVRGLGEELVNGTKDGSTYTISGSKVAVKGDKILSKKLLNKLMIFTKKIVVLTECFQDIEFAIKDNKVYFLQTRDITVYNSINPHQREMFIDNSNIIESYFGQTSPLTYTFAKDVYRDVYTCTLNAGKVRKKIMDSLKPSLQEMLYYYNGRVYYNMKSWYHVTSIFPFKKSTNYMENMMGVKSSSSDFKRVKMNLWDMIKLGCLFVHKVINIDKLSDKFLKRFDDVVMPYYGKEINMDNEELKELFKKIECDITKDFSTPIINDCAVMIFFGILKEKIMKMKNVVDKEDLLSKCINNNGNVESCGSSTYLEAIAEKIKESEETYSDFSSLSVDELYQKYHQKNNILYESVMDYIIKYGSRVTDELKMETITMIEDNKMVYSYLKNIVSTDITKNDSENKLVIIPRKLRLISKLTRKYIQNREKLRLRRTYIYSVVRNIFLCFGRNLVKIGRIDAVRDVFYLTKEELFNYQGDLRVIIDRRKEEEKSNLNKPYYDRYVFYANGKVLEIKNNNINDGLTGIPSGAGIVTAKATIMNSNKDYLEKGNIIVTKRTDPGWISLFPLTSGLVVEHGSMLSHSFVVAREMGIPAVVGVNKATSLIKNNDTITLDGVSGVIRVENK